MTVATDHRDGHDGVDVRGLSVHYGRAVALDRVDARFEAGAINAIVGQNGAGKSSLLMAMYGAVENRGRVTVDGQDISGLRPAQRARRGIGFVPQGRQTFPTLTVRENLAVFAEVLGVGRDEIDASLERFPRLVERAGTLSGNLSGGEQQMLAVTRALMTEGRVLLLDEMATGLAPVIVDQLISVARDLADSGATVVMAEASIATVAAHVDRGYVLTRGEITGQADGGTELDELYRQTVGITG